MTDFGETLRLAREGRGISLRQIAARTKIPIAALEALERNDVSKLPGGIFSRAFVRSYAQEVGLDPDETLRTFLDRFEGFSPPPVQAPAVLSDADRRFVTQQHAAGIALKAALVSLPLLGIILYFAFRTDRGDERVEPATTATSGSGVPTAASSAGQVPPAVVRDVRSSPDDKRMTIEIQASGDCWVKLTADGHTALARLMHAGDKESRQIREAAVIEVGDAGASAFNVDGRAGKPLGRAGQVRIVRITTRTVAQYLE
jgi:cytoskeleton protein RodZ